MISAVLSLVLGFIAQFLREWLRDMRAEATLKQSGYDQATKEQEDAQKALNAEKVAADTGWASLDDAARERVRTSAEKPHYRD